MTKHDEREMQLSVERNLRDIDSFSRWGWHGRREMARECLRGAWLDGALSQHKDKPCESTKQQ